MSAAVELFKVSKSFPGVTALDAIDLTLLPGSIHALVGENGAGKSTLINILSGLLSPDGGEVRIAGTPVRLGDVRAARRLGVVTVHQEVDLFPTLSVMENIGFEQGWPSRLINWRGVRRRTCAAFHRLGVDVPPDALAGTLSPAHRQLVEIAAALSQPVRVLILDEPTSSLSAQETELLFGHLRRLRGDGASVLYVSHRLEDIFALADTVTVLRDGRHVWTGPVADSSPKHLIGLMVDREVGALHDRRKIIQVRSASGAMR